MKKIIIISFLFFLITPLVNGQTTPTQPIPWTGTVGTDMLGRELPTWAEAGQPRQNRWFGLLFSPFPGWSNRIGTFYDVHKYLLNHPFNRKFEFDPPGSLVFPNWSWAEPWCGYYHGADPWVIRKQLIDMATAGYEYVFWDFTNGGAGWNNWNPTVSENWAILKQYLEIGTQLQQQGVPVPRITVWLSTDIEKSMEFCYNLIYKDHKYDNMIFNYKGRPLLNLMAGLDRSFPNTTPGFKPGYTKDLDSTKFTSPSLLRTYKNFFTFRLIWDMPSDSASYSRVWNSWGNYPAYDENGKIECMGTAKAVGAPIFDGLQTKGTSSVPGYNLNISNYNGQWCTPDVDKGLRNERTWNKAHTFDAPMVLSSRYNEWYAACWAENGMTWLGKTNDTSKGEGVFIDLFNPEFSGDLEPMKDLYKDNYYWQNAGHLRIHKGVTRPDLPAGPADININGSYTDWTAVKPVFIDPANDIAVRDFKGNPTFIEGTKDTLHYKNTTARNDIIESRVTYNASNVFFYVKTNVTLSPSSGTQWMVLFVDADRRKNTGWEGYDLRINYSRIGDSCTIDTYDNGNWSHIANGFLRATGNQLEMALPRIVFGENQTMLAFDFKWCDNCLSANPNAMDFWINGEVAPQTRLNYRFSEQQDSAAFGGVPWNIPGIIEAENYNNGGAEKAFHDNTPEHIGWAYNYRNNAVDMDYLPDNKGMSIGHTSSGEWLTYSVYASSEGDYTPVLYASSNDNNGAFHIEADGTDKTGKLLITSTGGSYQPFTFNTKKIHLTAGKHFIKIVFEGSFNLDAWGLISLCETPRAAFKNISLPGTVEAEDFDTGCEGLAYHDAFNTNTGGAYRQTGVDISTCSEGGFCISNITTGEWLEYTVNVPNPGIYKMDLRISASKDANKMHVLVNGIPKTSDLLIGNTGGKDIWTTITRKMILPAGQQVIRLFIDQADEGLFINKLTFSLLDTCTPQHITFDSIPNIKSTVSKTKLNAISDATLPVSFLILNGPAIVKGDTLRITKYIGNVTVKAYQNGNATTCPDSTQRSFTIIHDCNTQTITYDPIPTKTATDPPFPINSHTNAGLPVVLDIRSGPASINGNTITLQNMVGTIKFLAEQVGDSLNCPVKDTSLVIIINLPQHQCTSTDGQIMMERWDNIQGMGISSIPLDSTPTSIRYLTKFEIPANAADYYGARVRGIICAPYTADYIFYISSDDESALWLSTDTNKANKQQIARVPGWVNQYVWDQYPEQKSAPIHLEAGKKYYIEALMKEGPGGDHLEVKWQTVYGIDEIIPGTFLNLPCKQQTINFASTTTPVGSNKFLMKASSTSGLPLNFKVTSGPATISGDTIILLSNGRVVVKASQPGNDLVCKAIDKSQLFVLSKTNSIDELFLNENIDIFPNPANDYIIIKNSISDNGFKIKCLTMYDISGRPVLIDETPFDHTKTVDISSIDNGIYFVHLTTSIGTVRKKIVKQ